MTENCKLRKALFSSFYNISQRNFGILLILWCSFKLWWNFCLDQNFGYKGKGPLLLRFSSSDGCERVDELWMFRWGYIYSEHLQLTHSFYTCIKRRKSHEKSQQNLQISSLSLHVSRVLSLPRTQGEGPFARRLPNWILLVL
jgi:hypothetical protein